jgi:hypothetical protein
VPHRVVRHNAEQKAAGCHANLPHSVRNILSFSTEIRFEAVQPYLVG